MCRVALTMKDFKAALAGKTWKESKYHMQIYLSERAHVEVCKHFKDEGPLASLLTRNLDVTMQKVCVVLLVQLHKRVIEGGKKYF